MKPFHIVERKQYHPVFGKDAYKHLGYFIYRNNKCFIRRPLTRRNARELTKVLNRILCEV